VVSLGTFRVTVHIQRVAMMLGALGACRKPTMITMVSYNRAR
jgi:hypothetical protein